MNRNGIASGAPEGRKQFFFEKKNQKTSIFLSGTFNKRIAMNKSFLVLFFKKERLTFLASSNAIALS
jgi:hypothetical protein